MEGDIPGAENQLWDSEHQTYRMNKDKRNHARPNEQ
jgi:hypothetical protein